MKTIPEQYKDYARSLRREFHRHPEASFAETWTSARIEKELSSLGIDPRRVGATGILGDIVGTASDERTAECAGRCIALRADIDALELHEQSGEDYASRNPGFMHACGHDAHTAALLTAARMLQEKRGYFSGRVRLIFQPAEETGGGAPSMIRGGALDGVGAIFGLHVWNDLATGLVNLEPGPRMASASRFVITIKGRGGHGALPDQGVDALLCGSAIAMNLQSIVSREISPLQPAVVSLGVFKSGSRFNILAEEAYLEGTARCYDMAVNEQIKAAIERIASETARSYRASAELQYEQTVIPTINEPGMTELARRAATRLLGKESLAPQQKVTGGEDFSYYGQLVPAAFAFVGSRRPTGCESFPHHHPKFDIDEDALPMAAALYAEVALEYLAS